MKKKVAIFMMLVALVAVPVFAATTDQNQAENECSNQMPRNQQMMQQAVDSGTITADEAAVVKDHMQQIAPIMEKVMKKDGMMNGMMQNGSTSGNCNNSNTK